MYMDLSPDVMGKLRELAYDGPVICEPFAASQTRLRSMSPEDVLSEVSDAMTPLVRP